MPGQAEQRADVEQALVASQGAGAVDPQGGALAPSVYGLEMALRDWQDRPISLDVNRGHPTLISMFYGSCRSACPVLINDIKRVQSEATAAGHEDLRVLMVSFDPDRDDSAMLSDLTQRHELDVSRWTLAAPLGEDARDLSAILGISWRDIGNGMFQHDSFIILLDADGHPLARLEGLNMDATPLLEAMPPS